MNDVSASNGSTPPSQTPQQSGQSLALLGAVYLLTWWFVITGVLSHDLAIYQLALVALVGEGIYCFAKSRTASVLKQWWQARSSGAKVGIGCATLMFFEVAFLILPFWPIAPLVTGFRHYFGATRSSPRQHLTTLSRQLQPNSGSFSGRVATTAIISLLVLVSATGVVMSHPNDGFTGSGTPTQTTGQKSGTGGSTQPVAIANTLAPTNTPIPTPKPTSTPKPKPTATPAPACNTDGAPPNPWCFSFQNTGKLIYNPPGNFCAYFNCIKSFWTSTNGYVDECRDGTYSHSGGVRGACSDHGGELRPLYAP